MKKLLASILCIGILGFAGWAKAAPITFDEFAVGTVIDDEYVAQGVRFHAGTYNLPVISMNLSMPNQPILRPDGGPTTFAGDFWMEFITPVWEVSFQSGYWDVIGTAQIDFWDASLTTLLHTATNTMLGAEDMAFAGLGSIGWIYFNSVNDPAGGDIDNLDFTAVPEPSTILLLGSGLLGLGYFSRRKFRG